jgi:hypothetical protein
VLKLSSDAAWVSAILLLATIGIEFGGFFIMQVIRGGESATDFQLAFARAGHGHAGIFATLGLVTIVLTDATHLPGIAAWVARGGVPAAAILLPAGFFLSSIGAGRTTANRAIWLVWAGAAAFTAGVATLGIGLLVSRR